MLIKISILFLEIKSDNLEKLIGGNGNIIANDNIVNDETLPERLIKTSVTVTPVTHLNLDEDNLISATLIDATNVPVVGKEVNILINGEVVGTGETDENGVCVISGFPASEQHLVNVAAEGYEVFSEYHSTSYDDMMYKHFIFIFMM